MSLSWDKTKKAIATWSGDVAQEGKRKRRPYTVRRRIVEDRKKFCSPLGREQVKEGERKSWKTFCDGQEG